MIWLLAAVVAAYTIPHAMPDPALAFYVGRGWLGVAFAWALWRGVRLSWPVAAVVALFEASTSVCGVLYAEGADAAFRGMCDAGSGLPVNLLGLTGAVLAAAHTIRQHSTGGNDA